MLVYTDTNALDALKVVPKLNREKTADFVSALFPRDKLTLITDGSLQDTFPPNDEIFAGCFSGVSIIAAKEFGIARPSELPQDFVGAESSGILCLHAMHSVDGWFAYAKWTDGTLQRALSVNPESGAIEDLGSRLPFEEPYWSGKHPPFAEDEDAGNYPLPFHPLELGDAALQALFGYQLEGWVVDNLLEPDSIPLMRFKRSRFRWKFWE